MLHLGNLIAIVSCVAVIAESQMIDSSVCTESRHNGHCYGMYLAWYYDVSSQECKEFVYGGCGGNGNRFKTEEDCYTHCTEKLVLLQPPMDVTVAVTQANYVYIFWYAPVNFKFHAPVNESDADIVDIYDNPGYSVVNDTEDSGKGDGVSHQMFVPLGPTSKPSTNNDNKDANNGSLSTSTKNNSSDSVPAQTNNTDSVNNQTSSPNSDSKQSNITGEVKTTAKPGVAQTTQESNITANTTNYKIIDFIGKAKVPFHFARLIHYIVSYKLLSDSEWKDFNVSLNQSEYNISGLQPSTEYKIRMSAVYLTNSSINTSEVSVTKRDPTVASQCSCNEYGTVGNLTCDLSLSSMPWCQCKTGLAGLFCELCNRGNYRTGPSLPCHKCPCTPESSMGSCRLMSGYLHCLKCKEGYAGNLCQRCANGYYRNKTLSNSCHKCTGCHGIKPELICHPISDRVMALLKSWHDVVVQCGENPRAFLEMSNREMACFIVPRPKVDEITKSLRNYRAKDETIKKIHAIDFTPSYGFSQPHSGYMHPFSGQQLHYQPSMQNMATPGGFSQPGQQQLHLPYNINVPSHTATNQQHQTPSTPQMTTICLQDLKPMPCFLEQSLMA